jgi:hypothetical protein
MTSSSVPRPKSRRIRRISRSLGTVTLAPPICVSASTPVFGWAAQSQPFAAVPFLLRPLPGVPLVAE